VTPADFANTKANPMRPDDLLTQAPNTTVPTKSKTERTALKAIFPRTIEKHQGNFLQTGKECKHQEDLEHVCSGNHFRADPETENHSAPNKQGRGQSKQHGKQKAGGQNHKAGQRRAILHVRERIEGARRTVTLLLRGFQNHRFKLIESRWDE
jgi:hypothetical protein